MPGIRGTRLILIGLAVVVAAAAGFTAGYALWGAQPDWYAARDIARLPPSPETELVAYGYRLVTATQRHLGPDVDAPLSPQEAWDVAAFVTTRPRPRGPPRD